MAQPKNPGGSTRLTIGEMQAIAATHGGRCLSTHYVNSGTPLEWECSKGHRWRARPGNVKGGTWCAACVKERTCPTLADIQRVARERGGRCLSDVYVNSYTHLLFECALGHRWYARPGPLLHGSWCPQCSHASRRRTIEQMRALAEKRGGRCLSDAYVKPPQTLRWRCGSGHEWDASADAVYDHWCRQCNVDSQRLGIGRMHKLAAAHGGTCLSSVYVNTRTPLECECTKGHRWLTTPMSIIAGSWCPTCRLKRYSLADMQALARDRGGECLSDTYVSVRHKLQWLCARGHTWSTTPATVMTGHWCPQCANLGRCRSRRARRRYEAVVVSEGNRPAERPQRAVDATDGPARAGRSRPVDAPERQ